MFRNLLGSVENIEKIEGNQYFELGLSGAN